MFQSIQVIGNTSAVLVWSPKATPSQLVLTSATFFVKMSLFKVHKLTIFIKFQSKFIKNLAFNLRRSGPRPGSGLFKNPEQ
jgi:hypothetical protein